MMQADKEKLKSILAQHFTYKEAIEKIRELLINGKIEKDKWNNIKSLILERKFNTGEALSLLALDANLPLDEDTDKEAYKWFELFIKNVESVNGIEEY